MEDTKKTTKIPEGYTDSPLGIIPNKWKIKEFGKFAVLSKNKYIPISTESKKCIELEHLAQNDGNILGYMDSFKQKSTKNVFKKGDILFGKLRPYLKKYWFATFDGVCSSEIWVLKQNPKECINIFLYYVIQSNKFIQISNVSSGSKMPRADWDYVSNYSFVIPSFPEQQKIAEILTTWDKAIEKQIHLIYLLEQRKHGLMQQLLTGKKRLKGFNEEWKTVKLEEIGNTYNGLTGKTKENFGNGNPFITYMNVFSFPKVNLSKVGYVNINANEKQNLVEYGDIFFTVSSETPKEVGMSSVLIENINNTYLNSFCFGFRLFDFKTLLPEYAQYFFRNKDFRKKMYVLAQGSTRFNISKKEVLKIKIKIPFILEQMVISKILTEANEEINIAKQKLESFRQQKKGLMQVLLTGKRRVKLN